MSKDPGQCFPPKQESNPKKREMRDTGSTRSSTEKKDTEPSECSGDDPRIRDVQQTQRELIQFQECDQ